MNGNACISQIYMYIYKLCVEAFLTLLLLDFSILVKIFYSITFI